MLISPFLCACSHIALSIYSAFLHWLKFLLSAQAFKENINPGITCKPLLGQASSPGDYTLDKCTI